MDFELTEEQKQIKTLVRDFCKREVGYQAARGDRKKKCYGEDCKRVETYSALALDGETA